MTLTVREKEHWKERIAARIKQRIEALEATTSPGLLRRVKAEALKVTRCNLGIDVEYHELSELIAKEERLREQKSKLASAIQAKLGKEGVQLRRYEAESLSMIDTNLESASKMTQRKILEADPIGTQILMLMDEEDRLLDTVWLATSNVQIRDLWISVCDFVKEQPSAIQSRILARLKPKN